MFADCVDELVGLSDSELVERMRANESERRRLDAEMAAALAVADRRGVKELDGHRSMTSFCRANFNWSTSEAGRRLGLARAVDHLDGFGERWHEGRFGLPQAVQFSKLYGNKRVRDRLAEFVPTLLDHAEQLPSSDFDAVVRHFVANADEDGAHDDRDAAIEGRSARVTDVGGSLDIRVSGGDGLTTAEMIAIHDRFTEREYLKDLEARRREHGELADGFALARTDRQRRFDALVEIFRCAASAGDIVTSPAEPLVNVVIDAGTWGRMLVESGLSASADLDGRPIDPFTGLAVDTAERLIARPDELLATRCETTGGVALHSHDVLRAALAGHVRRAVVDARHVVIDMGRRQRLFTGNARQAAKLLVRHCHHPGCELPTAWCDVDHMVEWGDRGATDQDNGDIECNGHNREKHRRRWRTRRASDGRVITSRADGTLILPVGVRPPTFQPTDDDDDTSDIESPDEIARLTTLARQRVDALRPAA